MIQNLLDVDNILMFLVLLLLVCQVLAYRSISSRQKKMLRDLKDSIKYSVQPVGDIPLGVEEIVELAVEIWRVEQRLSKVSDKLGDIHKRGLESSMQRLKRYLQKYDVEIQDYTNQKYNEGFNFEILSVEKDAQLQYPIIKETVEPTVICKGRVVNKAKVVLASSEI